MRATGRTALPAALTGWSSELAALDVGVAVALGPLIHRLDELVGRHTTSDGHLGEPDGLDGIGRRGIPERLLVGEWLLAQELPEEFFRRAADSELMHLQPARMRARASGDVAVVVDVGPWQVGGPRLVQLALLIVLARRARVAGAGLRVGLLHAEPGRWLPDGSLRAVLERWLAQRTAAEPAPEAVTAWGTSVDDVRHLWLLTSPRLGTLLGPHVDARPDAGTTASPPAPTRRVVTSEATDWSAQGATAVCVRLAGERLHLSLPAPAMAVRVLRGEGWRRDADVRAPGTGTGTPAEPATAPLSHPMLCGWRPTLICRQGPDAVLVARLGLPVDGGPARRPPKCYVAPGPVVAAGTVGDRLVVLYLREGIVLPRIWGRRLADVDDLSVAAADVGVDPWTAGTGPLGDVLFRDGALLGRLAGRWRRLGPADSAGLGDWLAAAPSPVVDSPLVARAYGADLWARGAGSSLRAGPVTAGLLPGRVHLGAGSCAWYGPDGWRAAPLATDRRAGDDRVAGVPVDVPAEHDVLGLVRLGEDDVRLLVRSPAGLLLRLVGTRGSTTLTGWSFVPDEVSVHREHPLVARRTPQGEVLVVDVATRRQVLRVAAPEGA